MNVENMLKVADAIESRQVADRIVGFNMNTYHNELGLPRDADGNVCGSTACVAGFATLLERSERRKKITKLFGRDIPYHEIGAEYLGLTSTQAQHLFLNSIDTFNEHNPLVPDALRWMALTGRVAWRKAIRAARCVKESQP